MKPGKLNKLNKISEDLNSTLAAFDTEIALDDLTFCKTCGASSARSRKGEGFLADSLSRLSSRLLNREVDGAEWELFHALAPFLFPRGLLWMKHVKRLLGKAAERELVEYITAKGNDERSVALDVEALTLIRSMIDNVIVHVTTKVPQP